MVSPPPWEQLLKDRFDGVHDSETVFSVWGHNSPLVIAAPHGGNLLPPTIPDRTSGCIEPDHNSAQLAWAIFRFLCRQNAGSRPHLVIGKLHRKKVDLARPRHSSSSSQAGLAAWDDYHSTIQKCLDQSIQTFGGAHLVDIHGQSHRNATEVGHMLTNSDLRGDMDMGRSSLSAVENSKAFTTLEDVVRGPYAIGSLLEKMGYAAVPSERVPHPCYECECCDGAIPAASCNESNCNDAARRPCTGFDVKMWCGQPKRSNDCGFGPCSFFWGANTLAMYGGGRKKPSQLAEYRGVVAATQLETQWSKCRDSDEAVAEFGAALARAIAGFVDHFYAAGALARKDEGDPR